MGKITHEFETIYEVGDIIVFEKHDVLKVGMVEGYYVDDGYFWFNVRVSPSEVYTYSNKGDIAEYDILGVLEGELKDECLKFITKGDE